MSDDTDLIAAFKIAAQQYGEGIASFDVDAINRNADRMSHLFQRIVSSPSKHRPFLSLLQHQDACVRLMASAFGLAIDESSCTRVLNEFAAKGPYAFEAEQCLARWHDGEWALDSAGTKASRDAVSITPVPPVDDAMSFARSLRKRVSMSDIVDVHEVDMRIGCVNIHFVNLIGVDEGSIEFCPDSDPPTSEELLAWAWVIRPDMSKSILSQLGDHDLANGIRQLKQ